MKTDTMNTTPHASARKDATFTVTYTSNESIGSERLTYASGLTWDQAVEICLRSAFPHMRIIPS